MIYSDKKIERMTVYTQNVEKIQQKKSRNLLSGQTF